jgi:hypothetical protein
MGFGAKTIGFLTASGLEIFTFFDSYFGLGAIFETTTA